MRIKLASLIAMTALLGACDTPCEDEVITSGQGGIVESTPEPMAPTNLQEDFIASVGDRVFFAFDKSSLKPEGQETIAKQAEWLQKNASVHVTIQGHCDPRGTSAYNMVLGERRANAAKEALISHGISADRIKVISFGKENPPVQGSTEEAYAQNRVAITVLD